jgi:hypothetical protein
MVILTISSHNLHKAYYRLLRTEFADLKSEVKSININIKWIMAIGLLIVGILLKNTFIH